MVILDNCSIHHDEDVRSLIEDECGMCLFFFDLQLLGAKTPKYPGAKLIYLPPYSPDFNPIEQSFHSLKAWLRRHENEAVNDAVRPWLIHQAAESITSNMAQGWISNCGYSFLDEM